MLHAKVDGVYDQRMVVIGTTCIVCGSCEILPALMKLTRMGGRNVYWFIHCDLEQWRTANSKVVDALLSAKVPKR